LLFACHVSKITFESLIADLGIADLFKGVQRYCYICIFKVMINRFIFTIVIALLAGCKQEYKNPHVVVRTNAGEIELELYPRQAPKTVAAFLGHVDVGRYNYASFYRVLNDENQPSNAAKTSLIQGGIWLLQYKAFSFPGIPHETTKQTGILHKSGTISMARTKPGTATTEFFICIGDQPGLDYGGDNNPDGQGYAAFGRVVKGMDVVKTIYKRPEDDQYFHPPVNIFGIKRL
jgi:peptidyl-prolyl cis-trans isomerase A (cyclophilin A)